MKHCLSTYGAMKETELSDLSFAEALTKLIREKGFTLRKLGELCGLDHTYLCRLAKGTYRGSDRAIKKVAKALGVEPYYFWEWRMRRLEEYLLGRIGKEQELIRERAGVLRMGGPQDVD